MPIQYIAAYKAGALIAEYPKGDELPTFSKALKDGLANVPQREHRRQIVDDMDAHFAYIADEGFIVACVATKDVRDRVIWDCLSKAETQTHSQPDAKMVKRLLEARMKAANSGEGDKIREVQDAIEVAKDAALKDVDLALQRGQKLDDVHEKTKVLAEQSMRFEDYSTKQKQEMCRRHVKFMAIIAGGTLLFILVVLLIVCKPNFSNC